MRYPCSCCGFLTLLEDRQDSHEICEVCFWEDDVLQFKYPDYKGGANVVSLNVAKANFQTFGACEKKFINNVRAPNASEYPRLE